MNKVKIINSTTLKIIAATLMLIDHVGDIFFPKIMILRYIGRLSFPIFAFCVSEGFYYTRNKPRYLLNLFSFAILTEPIFDLAFYSKVYYTGHQNVLFTFSLSVLFLMIFDKLRNNKELAKLLYHVPELLLFIVFSFISIVIQCDYSYFGFGLVFLFYLFRNKNYKFIIIPIYQLLSLTGYSLYAVFSNIILLLYNNQKGRSLKYFFYLFYPVHLLILYIIKVLI